MLTPCNIAPAGHRALRKGRVNHAWGIYHLTAVVAGREPVFADRRAAFAACRCFANPETLREARLLAWVLMPDHAHWLIQIGEEGSVQESACRLKSLAARAANHALGRHGRLWTHAYHDHALRRDEDVLVAARYIIANPLRAGLVERICDYPYWDSLYMPQERACPRLSRNPVAPEGAPTDAA